ncbi:c-type cytochrome [Nitrococcus mobilis]|uniref:Cytochrome c5 n=1 Tax=Nitrococcus mobilis Nb-231 TaxID=314278 RepID=A4BV27_9GAMM|nr:c-type cytochrome [Nitrococcus mobilis]EAR20448.1 Cytochrome c5 [Nitrococcus mobilis Nb-231]
MSQEQDRRFIRNFIVVLAALALAGVLFAILANIVVDDFEQPGQRAQQIARLQAELQAERMQPVGQVNTTDESATAAGESDARSGEQVVKQVCSACHTAQFMNAPQIGNKAEWAPRAKEGLDTLTTHVLQGFGNMPPQSGSVSEAEVRAAIEYMVENKTGIDLN